MAGEFSTLKRRCRETGAALRKDRTVEYTEVAVDAPAGRRWSASSTHEVVFMVNTFGTAAADYDAIARLLLPDIDGGLEACDDGDCERCNSEI